MSGWKVLSTAGVSTFWKGTWVNDGVTCAFALLSLFIGPYLISRVGRQLFIRSGKKNGKERDEVERCKNNISAAHCRETKHERSMGLKSSAPIRQA